MKKFVKLSKVKRNSELRADEMLNVKGGASDDSGELVCYGVIIEDPEESVDRPIYA